MGSSKVTAGESKKFPFYAENIWPEHPEDFRTVFEACYRAMENLAARLVRIFAVALDLPERYIDDKIDHYIRAVQAGDHIARLGGQMNAAAWCAVIGWIRLRSPVRGANSGDPSPDLWRTCEDRETVRAARST